MVETYLLTTLTVQTLVASKAARVTAAAQGRPVVDFGSRRAHGPQAGLLAARAAFIGGCTATSNTEAARLLGIPAGGTQAHAWVLAFGDETEAFRRFGQVFSQPTFLIDTFDTLQGLKNALACEIPFQAVRLDSGDLEMLSKEVRARLDALGRQKVKIVASGDLQEYKIRDLLAAGAPIDVFGVGTEMVCSRDEPSLNAVYKLVEQETPQGVRGRFKLAPGKETYPMAKQVYRQITPEGRFLGDLVTAATESSPGIPLLEPVLHGGRLIKTLPSLEESQRYRKEQCSRLPAPLLALEPCSLYSVQVSETLQKARRGGSGR
jgi:nicotinate phosphoribosyltransferase